MGTVCVLCVCMVLFKFLCQIEVDLCSGIRKHNMLARLSSSECESLGAVWILSERTVVGNDMLS